MDEKEQPENIRPWGRYDILDAGVGYKVKRITVEPGRRLSYQRHRLRSEFWTLVAGVARVTLDDVVTEKKVGEQVFVHLGAKHRIENIGREAVVFIEVQLGAYLAEDDIERFDDDYGRLA
jgi:mannose-6-phosphate isomerase-like protein (cupin superfamily)